MTCCRCLWSSPQCPKINLSTHHPTYLFQTFSSSLAVIIGSSIPREVAQPSISDSSDTLLILLPWRMKTYGNHCYLNCQLQCLSLNPFVEVYSCATDKINKDKKLFYDSLYVWCVVDLLCDIGRGKTISTVQRMMKCKIPLSLQAFCSISCRVYFSNQKDLLPNIVHVTIEYLIEYQKCNRQSSHYSTFMQLMLPIVKAGNKIPDIFYCLDTFLSKKRILAWYNQLNCDRWQVKKVMHAEGYLEQSTSRIEYPTVMVPIQPEVNK